MKEEDVIEMLGDLISEVEVAIESDEDSSMIDVYRQRLEIYKLTELALRKQIDERFKNGIGVETEEDVDKLAEDLISEVEDILALDEDFLMDDDYKQRLEIFRLIVVSLGKQIYRE